MTRIVILVTTLCVVALCPSFVIKGEAEGDDEYLRSVVFKTEGEPKSPEEFLINLKALNQVWNSRLSLVNALVELAEIPDCNAAQIYLKFANRILNNHYENYIDIYNYVKYQRLILVKKCVQDWTKAYIGSYYELSAMIRGESAVLKEQIRLAKDDGLFSYGTKQFYPKRALIKGVYNFLRTRSSETAMRIDKKKDVHRKDFDKLYNDSVKRVCRILLTEEVAKNFFSRSRFFLEQVNVDETLISFFKSDVKDFMSRVHICLDIEKDPNLSSDVYNLVKEKSGTKKSFLEKSLLCSK